MALFSNIHRLAALDLSERRVFLRADLDARFSSFGGIVDDTALRVVLPTLRALQAARSRVVLAGHFGDAAEPAPSNAARAVVRRLQELLGGEVSLLGRDFWGGIRGIEPGEVALAPNLLDYPGELGDDPAFTSAIAQSIDVYVGDGLRAAQQEWASVRSLPLAVPTRSAGLLLGRDLDLLELIAGPVPTRPYFAVVGGDGFARRSQLLWALLLRADALLLGGVVANTCLSARGWNPGLSRYEPDQLDQARIFLAEAERRGVPVHVPRDALVVRPEHGLSSLERRAIADVGAGEAVVDIGIETCLEYRELLGGAATVLWSGLLGRGDAEETQTGSYRVAQAIAGSAQHSVVFGARTVATLDALDQLGSFEYVSRGGDAALALASGSVSVGIESLRSPD